MLLATSEYLASINTVGNFIRDTFEVTNDANDMITASDVFAQFKVYDQSSTFKQQIEVNGFAQFQSKTRGPLRDAQVYSGLKKSTLDIEDAESL